MLIFSKNIDVFKVPLFRTCQPALWSPISVSIIRSHPAFYRDVTRLGIPGYSYLGKEESLHDRRAVTLREYMQEHGLAWSYPHPPDVIRLFMPPYILRLASTTCILSCFITFGYWRIEKSLFSSVYLNFEATGNMHQYGIGNQATERQKYTPMYVSATD